MERAIDFQKDAVQQKCSYCRWALCLSNMCFPSHYWLRHAAPLGSVSYHSAPTAMARHHVWCPEHAHTESSYCTDWVFEVVRNPYQK